MKLNSQINLLLWTLEIIVMLLGNYAITQLCDYAIMQSYNYTIEFLNQLIGSNSENHNYIIIIIQLWNDTIIQLCIFMQIYNYAIMQLCLYAIDYHDDK